ncbi:Methyltransferase type 11 [Desulfatibacillum aliphaticivorans]|uniref:Methyltransferase type 11 n=1 Tax=Desulfatibacillum aliphaticivorans TaxID=218208 RepID=B8FLM0_DESAL|nr:class I SAM-dependent methyltransferase [Desulfatibacillum aliphaticivorans]ACL05374.1 Methyltransferase type 11 [Desulfatibacillum aliphaticivorans]
MFDQLEKINQRPLPYEFYTAQDLWDDDYVSTQMLEYHLNPDSDLASRKMEFIDRSAQWIAARFGLGEGKSVCDFGCGPGLYTSRFAQTGAKVTGLDFSRNSLAYAKRQAEENGFDIEYRLGNYLDFQSDEKYDLITMIYLDFCPLSPEQRKTLLDIFHKHLKDDGRVFMDVLTLAFFEQSNGEKTYEYSAQDGFWAAGPYYVFNNTWKYTDINLLLNKHVIVEENRTREICNWLQCFDRRSFAQEAEAGGFEVLESYSNTAGGVFEEKGTEMAMVLKKH